MFRFVTSMFGCPHDHCTFPITARRRPMSVSASNQDPPVKTTYVVCLDCGQEFPYDWKEMKLMPKQAA